MYTYKTKNPITSRLIYLPWYTYKAVTTDIRTRILDAAVLLLETEGAKSFGQTRVARAAGVKQGNITYHFPKKADLVAAVVQRVNERRVAELEDLVERAHQLEPQKLRALLFERLPTLATDAKRSRVMLALLIEGQRDPSVAKLLMAVNARQRAALSALLQRDPDDLDLQIVLATISGLSLAYGLGDGETEDHVKAVLQRFGQWLPTLLGPASAARPGAPAGSADAAPGPHELDLGSPPLQGPAGSSAQRR